MPVKKYEDIKIKMMTKKKTLEKNKLNCFEKTLLCF